MIARVAKELGVGAESLRNWVNRAEVDSGRRPGLSSGDAQRIAELEREVRELRRANDILRAARFSSRGSSNPKLHVAARRAGLDVGRVRWPG